MSSDTPKATVGAGTGPRKWHIYNNAPSVEHSHHGEFKITAPRNTDIWRRTDEDDVFNAPFVYQMIGAWEFDKITVTVEASWKTQYDQGGLVLVFPSKVCNPPFLLSYSPSADHNYDEL